MDTPDYVEAYLARVDWGANPLHVQTGHAIDEAQVVGVVEHHTVFALRDWDSDGILRGDLDDIRRYMRVLQHARPDLGDEVPYSWVIFAGTSDDRCVIAEGRGRGRSGAHTAGLNSTRYAFAIAGNTDADQPVTTGMIAGMRWLAATVLVDPEHAVPAIGHQQAPPYYSKGANLNATGCPGRQGMSVLPQLQPPYRLTPGADPATPSEEDDEMKILFVQTAGDTRVIRCTAGMGDPILMRSEEQLAHTYALAFEQGVQVLGKIGEGGYAEWQGPTPGIPVRKIDPQYFGELLAAAR